MYAVIQTGGKQYRVSAGQVLKIERLTADVGSTVDFEQVLMIGGDQDFKIGTPFLDGRKIQANVVSHGRHDKIRVVKHRRRKHYHKEMGHRQDYTEVKFNEFPA